MLIQSNNVFKGRIQIIRIADKTDEGEVSWWSDHWGDDATEPHQAEYGVQITYEKRKNMCDPLFLRFTPTRAGVASGALSRG